MILPKQPHLGTTCHRSRHASPDVSAGTVVSDHPRKLCNRHNNGARRARRKHLPRALKRLSDVTVVDEAAFGGCLDEISHALLQANICFAAVRDLQTNVKAAMFEEMQQASRSRRP
jgi:hypothetical protein